MNYKKLAIMVFMMILLSVSVAALGVSPGRTTITFEPDAKHTIEFDIINDLHKDMNIMLKIEGVTNEIVSLNEQQIHLGANDERRKVSYTVKLPSSYDEPGTKEIRIIVVEMPDPNSQQPQISTLVGVVSQLRIKVPQEGKYVKLDELEISEAMPGETVSFRLPVENLGTEDLSLVKATIKIYNPNNELVGQVLTQEVSLNSKRRDLLTASWKADVPKGKYKAVAEVTYDGSLMTTEKEFRVGDIGLEVLRIFTKNYELGDIAKMDIVLRSTWNEVIKDVFAELIIKDKEGDQVGELKTANRDYAPQEEAAISAYWDTYGLSEGTYNGNLKVYTGAGTSIEKQFQVTLDLTQLTATLLGATAYATLGDEGSSKGTILMIFTVILFLVNLTWFFFRKRISRGKESIDTVIKGPERTGKENLKDLHSKINKLHDNLEKIKVYEKELDNKVARYQKMYKLGEIKYAEYEYLLNQALKGKSIEEWRRYYKNHGAETKDTITRLKKEAEKANRK